MSLLSRRPVADAVARLGGVASRLARPTNLFADIPARVTATKVPTRTGPVRVTIYDPPPTQSGRPGVYLNFHGGGFVFGHPRMDDPLCRFLAERAGVVVVNVDYGLAPRHRFPAAILQGYDVALWAGQPGNAWDETRVCAGGQSAGGAIAAGVARLLWERDNAPLALQVLHYPVLDMATPASAKHALALKPVLSPRMGELFSTAYIPQPARRATRLASPALPGNCADLAGISPALVITCELDLLHDEGVAYVKALAAAGALREHIDIPGQDHGYDLMDDTDPAVVEVVYTQIAAHVRAATGA